MVTLDSLSIVSSTPLNAGFDPPDVGAQEVVHQARKFEIYIILESIYFSPEVIWVASMSIMGPRALPPYYNFYTKIS